MILEQGPLATRIWDAITESLVPAAIQSPEDEIVTHVVPHDADGDLYVIDGVIDVSVLVQAVVDEVWPDVEVRSTDTTGRECEGDDALRQPLVEVAAG